MHKLEDLKIWNKAMEVAEEVYLLTANFPKEEKFGLISQLRSSAVSIPSNIAELFINKIVRKMSVSILNTNI